MHILFPSVVVQLPTHNRRYIAVQFLKVASGIRRHRTVGGYATEDSWTVRKNWVTLAVWKLSLLLYVLVAAAWCVCQQELDVTHAKEAVEVERGYFC